MHTGMQWVAKNHPLHLITCLSGFYFFL